MSLPAADDLFRPTAGSDRPAPDPTADPAPEPAVRAVTESDRERRQATERETEREAARLRRTSGRVRHDEKMTVYVTSSELHDLEHARLVLRSAHGIAVDRGRLVREALAVVLADFEANGEDSVIVRRLDQS